MGKTVKRILKSGDIELNGKFHLDTGLTSQNNSNPHSINAGASNVKIVENSDEFAVLEFTCSCGLKTLIKCQYAAQKN